MVQEIIKEIEKALDNEMYLSALALTLTLPDICGKAEYPSEDSPSKRYKEWFNKYIGEYIKPPDAFDYTDLFSCGDVIYKLRCSVLHEGNPNLKQNKEFKKKNRVDRFILSIDRETACGSCSVTYGTQNGKWMVGNVTVEINIVSFCKDLCLEATNYYNDNKEKFDFFNYEIIDKREDYD